MKFPNESPKTRAARREGILEFGRNLHASTGRYEARRGRPDPPAHELADTIVRMMLDEHGFTEEPAA